MSNNCDGLALFHKKIKDMIGISMYPISIRCDNKSAVNCTQMDLAEPLVFATTARLNRVVPAQKSNAKLERNDRCERGVNRLMTRTDPPVRGFLIRSG